MGPKTEPSPTPVLTSTGLEMYLETLHVAFDESINSLGAGNPQQFWFGIKTSLSRRLKEANMSLSWYPTTILASKHAKVMELISIYAICTITIHRIIRIISMESYVCCQFIIYTSNAF